MAVEPNTQQWVADTNRKVWVVNDYDEAYTETFRGQTYTIPPNGRKEVLMPFLAARRFLGQSVPPPDALPNGKFKSPPKALRTIELTMEEQKQVLGITDPESVAREQEAKAALVCTLCGEQTSSEKGLKIHTTKMHPHWSPVQE